MLIADLLTPDMAKCWGNFLSHKLKEKLKNVE